MIPFDRDCSQELYSFVIKMSKYILEMNFLNLELKLFTCTCKIIELVLSGHLYVVGEWGGEVCDRDP